ncbi:MULTISPECIES: NAD-dependent protein deacetylase [unclassified Streptomyces]|uniref:NAD-dependent protein deacetylase n=1 Tax=unclassified Streptomyces TaxID=2593676 RepID=UPI001660B322|nr:MULTISPECIES: NAD-dependent protein deacetylase [unclassified Streptomyces]MBD0707010.1 NAD-dependent protein deacetylase 1 [Streptomyces sp. CBMA291]MBD0712949.1 NAD-dependent protein deacetylase 1 [Streptomyces sp. CBMA370]
MRMRPTVSWTPTGDLPPATTDLEPVVGALRTGRVLVLSGAGISTESGIPDYRGEGGSLSRHTPMTYQDFTGGVSARRRYWARSHLGWRTFGRALPNDGHRAVAAFGRRGLLGGVITQNVDGLHQAAGSDGVVELHGSLDRVVCLTCGDTSARRALAERLEEANPGFDPVPAAINPDGDADLTDEQAGDFHVVPCGVCGGVLKPDVVFFGETVPAERVERCRALVRGAASVLVLGSSLTVMSGLRFVRQAADAGTPVVIVNRDPTRGDKLADVRVSLPLGKTLTAVAGRLGVPLDGEASGKGDGGGREPGGAGGVAG